MARQRGKFVDFNHLTRNPNVYIINVDPSHYYEDDINDIIKDNCRNGDWSYKFTPDVPDAFPNYFNDYHLTKGQPAKLVYAFENEKDAIFFKMAVG